MQNFEFEKGVWVLNLKKEVWITIESKETSKAMQLKSVRNTELCNYNPRDLIPT